MIETGKFPTDQSKVFNWFKLEQEQIAKHCWVWGERLGRSPDKAFVVWDWCANHRDEWLKTLRASGLL